jgi:hypothetical protein
MARMPADVSLFITCKALFPFVYPDLLIKDGNKTRPIDNAPQIQIADRMKIIEAQDKKFGLHQIADIMKSVIDQADAEGYSVDLSRKDFTGRAPTVGLLSSVIREFSDTKG